MTQSREAFAQRDIATLGTIKTEVAALSAGCVSAMLLIGVQTLDSGSFVSSLGLGEHDGTNSSCDNDDSDDDVHPYGLEKAFVLSRGIVSGLLDSSVVSRLLSHSLVSGLLSGSGLLIGSVLVAHIESPFYFLPKHIGMLRLITLK
jgi:hypothetical protein